MVPGVAVAAQRRSSLPGSGSSHRSLGRSLRRLDRGSPQRNYSAMSLVRAHAPLSTPALSATRWTAFAFVYWVAFMGALTPGNIQNGLNAGVAPDWSREVVRLTAAGILGASVTPLLLKLAARLPVASNARWRSLALQALALAVLAAALVLVSCVLAAWLFAGHVAPTFEAVAAQMRADMLLLVLCLSLLMAAIQVAPRLSAGRDAYREWPERLAVGERGRLVMVDLKSVDWIESQGNYQALHAGDAVHLLRETSRGLAARLDPARFVRIHRRFIVAADRVRDVEPLANGDAIVRLVSGVELRQSRQHRDALRARLLR